ncbi:hypothetical protein DPMN_168089 [Dreissena polymorpha]|uniref:Vacuolar protein sorting-associated protein 51 homolog n=1 Tax=Dreissena polymorpha TaxID=45954 RepID=A0A9D4F4Z5_DREPO|nr:hypothetical protein DPMN_168089 [Dreissena polymorpha]
MFLNKQDNEALENIAMKKLVHFVNSLMEQYFQAVKMRIQLERETGDNTILVRALDRFHRRLQAMNKLLPDTDFSRAGTDIVSSAARDRVDHYLESLKQHFADCLTDVRQNLASPRPAGKQEAALNLGELLSGVQLNTVDQVKSVLINLQVLISCSLIVCAHQPAGVHCSGHHVRHEALFPWCVLHDRCAGGSGGGIRASPDHRVPRLL